MEKNVEYAHAIYEVMTSLFDEDSENHRYDVNKIDGTQFFIGMAKACTLLFNKLTDDQKSGLEFTHLMNALIVQDMMGKQESA